MSEWIHLILIAPLQYLNTEAQLPQIRPSFWGTDEMEGRGPRVAVASPCRSDCILWSINAVCRQSRSYCLCARCLTSHIYNEAWVSISKVPEDLILGRWIHHIMMSVSDAVVCNGSTWFIHHAFPVTLDCRLFPFPLLLQPYSQFS